MGLERLGTRGKLDRDIKTDSGNVKRNRSVEGAK